MKGIKLSLISKEFRNVWVNQFWFFVRNQKGLNFIPPHGKESAFMILKEPLEGRSVIFVLDQYMGPPFGIPTKFFGRETGTAYGLALFVKKTKIPVVPVYTYYDKEFRLHIVAAPPLEVEALREQIASQTEKIQDCQGIYSEAHLKRRRGQEEDWIRVFIDECNRRLEEIILKRPEQWMWVHRRWKEWG
jgi:KDO2-lipid IV(A) lauroyltransferase